MLKFTGALLSLILLLFVKKSWHLVHISLYYLSFVFLMVMSPVTVYYNSVSYFLGCDVISFGLILLSLWICGLMIMASQSILTSNYNKDLFLMMVLFLLIMLFLTFSVSNLFLFYLFFEASLIPTLLLIMGWGYQPERMQAGMYLLFYTLLASLPLLLGIFYVYECGDNLFMPMLSSVSIGPTYVFYMVMIFAFLVKMPMFMTHLWLPKAHVEAPVSGSMILAGVLLKLGGYGLMRIFSMMKSLGLAYNFIWVSISLVGGCLISFICLRQTDLKALVAYSSVAHMGLTLGGLMTMTYWGMCGAYTMMIAHGLCSSGMFCLTNISYERLGSRSVVLNKGLMHLMPSMTLWWFLLSSANMAAPPTLNLLGEITLLNSLVGWCWVTMLTLMLLSFFSAAYTLYLYSYSQHGKFFSGTYSCMSGYNREYLLLFLHWAPLNLLIMKSEPLILWI